MSDAHTEKKPINWIAIVAPVLTVLWMVWFYDRELRINDLKSTIIDLRLDKKALEVKCNEKDDKIEFWINQTIDCNRALPQIIDTLKARIKNSKNE